MEAATSSKIEFLPHHKQQSLCTTRPLYRQGRKLTAVKVYTVNDESVHLLIHGVPSIGLLSEVSMLCERYGRVKSVKLVDQYSTDQEKFTNVYHVQFERIQSARFAKKILDNRSFFGGILHVCYAPELETINETKLKLVNRKREVAKRSRYSSNETNPSRNNVTNSIDEESFKISYEDKVSLGNIPDSSNSAIPEQTMFFASTSQSASTSDQLSSFVGPTMPSSSFKMNTQALGPAVVHDQISATDSLTSQDTVIQQKLKSQKAVNKNFSNPRKRPYSISVTDTQPLDSTSLSQIITDLTDFVSTKQGKVSKTCKAVHENFSHPREQPFSSRFISKIQPLDSPLVTHLTSHSKPSSTQVREKNLKAPEEIVTSNNNAATNNSSPSPLKKPVAGAMRFIPRSLTIKKKAT